MLKKAAFGRAKRPPSAPPRRPDTKKPPPSPPPPRRPIPFLADLKSTPDPAAALDLLLSSPPHLQDYPACSSLLYRLARSRLYSRLDSLLLFVRSRRVPCNVSLFNALIQHFGRARLPDRALDLFLSIPSFSCSSGLAPTAQTLNFLLDALVENGRQQEAESLLRKCRSMWSFRPNVVSFNIILKGRCEKHGVESARELFDEMLKKRIRPSVVTYNILIGHMSRSRCLDAAMGLKMEMGRMGIGANAVTYAVLMEGLCLEGKYDSARKMMFDMEYQGCKTRLVNYGVLMTDCRKRGDFDGMRDLLAEMKRRKIKPDVVIYGILINYLCEAGRANEAYKVLVDMQIKGCEVNAAIFRMMVDGFCRARLFVKGLQVLNAMLASKHCPREETFRCLVVGLSSDGKFDDALFVLEEMQNRKIELDLEDWEALLQPVLGKHDDGIEFLEDLISFDHMRSMEG